MDWIKVKTSHAEYDFIGAKDSVFRAWIMAMVFVAILEKIPTISQLEAHLGKQNWHDLDKHFRDNKISTVKVLKKVLEDVDVVKRKRQHGKEYMDYMRSCRQHTGNTTSTSRQHTGSSGGKIREDKIREDKRVSSLSDLSKKNPQIKASLDKMGLKL